MLHQGEQLDNTEKKLDSIQAMTKVTQRHLNNIKSVFGGIKNWFQKSDSPQPQEEIQHSRLRETLNKSDGQSADGGRAFGGKLQTGHPHKASRLYNESDEEEDEFRSMRTSSSTQSAMDDKLGKRFFMF